MNKSARKSAPGIPFRKGGDPRQGRGPERGAPNAGRPPSAVTELCRRLLTRHRLIEKVKDIAVNRKGKASDRLAAIRLLLEYAEGKPIQRQELAGVGEGGTIPVSLNIFDARNADD